MQHTTQDGLRPEEDISILLEDILANKVNLLSLSSICGVLPASKELPTLRNYPQCIHQEWPTAGEGQGPQTGTPLGTRRRHSLR